jgi:hypothetical protein
VLVEAINRLYSNLKIQYTTGINLKLNTRSQIVTNSYTQDTLKPHYLADPDVTFRVDILAYTVVVLVK